MFSKSRTSGSTGRSLQIERLKQALAEAEAVFIGTGAGMSTAAGYTYTGERFDRYFGDFAAKYGFRDMYSGGFTAFESPEEQWAFWSRYVWINRYAPIPGNIYADLLEAVRGRDYFVLTTNVDHCFQRAGFDKQRIFYPQGDYGLFQCSEPCCRETWDNEEPIRQMVLAQGYTIPGNGTLLPPENGQPAMRIPKELLPVCPHCGKPMSMNLRADGTFVQDAGWDAACARYERFVEGHRSARILYLEIGVGFNTPGIVKYNFWRQTFDNPNAMYVCLNFSEAYAPKEIADRSVCIDGDSAEVIAALKAL